MNEKMFQEKLQSLKELLQLQNTGITNILEKRLVFERLDKIIKSNKALNVYNLFWDWYFYNYIDSQIMEIMRILDTDQSSKNLLRFLDSLIAGQDMDGTFFERIRSGMSSSALSPEIIKSIVPIFDLDKLKEDRDELVNRDSIISIKNHRDWKTAHNDPQKWKNLNLNLVKLNDCIDFIHTKILHYELCLNGSGYPSSGLLPTIAYDWESIFRIPWIQ